MTRFLLFSALSLVGFGCVIDPGDCPPPMAPPRRAQLVDSDACKARVVKPYETWKDDGPTRLTVDYDEGLVVVEYEVKLQDGRTIPVKETWRRIDHGEETERD